MRNDGTEVIAMLLSLARELEGPLFEEVANKWARSVVLPEAIERCPKRTGALASSIEVTIGDNGISIKATKDYASYVHDGTSDIEANPFIEIAIENNIGVLLYMFEAEIERRTQ